VPALQPQCLRVPLHLEITAAHALAAAVDQLALAGNIAPLEASTAHLLFLHGLDQKETLANRTAPGHNTI
jgi:hypothetical protein